VAGRAGDGAQAAAWARSGAGVSRPAVTAARRIGDVPVAEPYDLDLLTLAELEQMEVLLRRIEERAALVRADATPAV
jgi:hypothetical protein